MACRAHVGRKFVNVFACQCNCTTEEAICRITDIYAVEKEVRGKPSERLVALRQARAKPIFADLDA